MLFSIVPSIRAQFDNAEVLGTVTDASGAVLANVNLLLRNQDTGVELRTTSDADGNFNFFDVKVGHHTLTAQLDGFATFTANDVTGLSSDTRGQAFQRPNVSGTGSIRALRK